MGVNHRLSEHLTWDEVRCKCGGSGTPSSCDGGVLRSETVELFERIRRRCCDRLGRDCPLKINSAVRCMAHNQQVGGSKESQHLKGKAIDLRCPEGISLPEFWSICEEEAGLGGFGAYPWGAHVDTAYTDPPRRWVG